MDKVRSALFSEKGMKAVNFLFFLALLLPNRGIIFAAYAVWIVYLAYCVRYAPSKGAQWVYKALIAFAGLMICLNLYFMVRAAG